MAKISIPCLVAKTNINGVRRWYWQPSKTLRDAGWTTLSLGKDETAAFIAARQRNDQVEAWKAGGPIPANVKRPVHQGTLGALIKRYRELYVNGTKPDGSPMLAESTRKTYNAPLIRLEAWAGKQPVAFVTPTRVRVLRDKMAGPNGIGHHAAHNTLKIGRQVFAFGRSDSVFGDLIMQNPFEDFGLAAPPARQVVISRPALEALIDAANAAGQHSIALAIQLGFATGQREADYLAMLQTQYAAVPEHLMQPEDFATLAAMAPDGVPRGIRIQQEKTGAWVEVPVTGQVREAVELGIARARRIGAATILVDDSRGRLYTGKTGQTRFQRDFAKVRAAAAEAVAAAGDEALANVITRVEFRDLRRTCVVHLGELGLDAHLIAGITGHDIDETQKILKTYMPRTTGRAARAIALSSAREKRAGKAANGA